MENKDIPISLLLQSRKRIHGLDKAYHSSCALYAYMGNIICAYKYNWSKGLFFREACSFYCNPIQQSKAKMLRTPAHSISTLNLTVSFGHKHSLLLSKTLASSKLKDFFCSSGSFKWEICVQARSALHSGGSLPLMFSLLG